MLENARRQLFLVLLVAVGAIVALASLPLNRGLDLSGGVQLIYEVDVDKAKRDGLLPHEASESDIARVMGETVSIISQRIDPQGTTEAVVTQRGPTGILVELPRMTGPETRAIEARIENLGRLEFRMVATDNYAKDGVHFSLQEEKRRLTEWLNANDGANRKLVAEESQAIRVFNNLSAEAGGPQSPYLHWYAKEIRPSLDDAKLWSVPMTIGQGAPTDNNLYNAVPAYTAEDWNGGRVKDGVERLVEYVPLNMHEDYFTGEDLDPSAIRGSIDDYGRPCILYKMKSERLTAYADWSETYTNECSAIILNSVVYSAPRFVGRILGNAQITGDFTQRQVDELVKTLRTGSLQVKPIQQSRNEIGATLGAHSIKLAFISIGVGAAFTLSFILAYYRLAGLVAFAALALNILLILGVVVAIRATLTLPGLAGLVLTMGMAVDSNILIYERIREELARGKEMLQACRAGFDRAIVTILDANLTTFIAGVVLYQVGIGPIRGFAVTLMVGILTTLFTAYFVSRLVFHFLLERNLFREFKVAAWFKDPNFNFMGWSRRAISISVLVIISGLVAFTLVRPDTKYAIDFTGGANLTVVLKDPISADDMRRLLDSDEEFHKLFPKPTVNTVGELAGGKATQFGVRLKLTEELRTEIDAARSADPENYQPPYLSGLRRVLGDRLVDDAYSDSKVYADVGDNRNTAFAEIKLHFAHEVEATVLREALKGLSATLQVTPIGTESSLARNFLLEFDVPKESNPDLLFSMVQGELRDLRDPQGNEVGLSNPIPESAEIGGRMVGELRNSAVSALFIAMFGIVMYIRVRFHEYKYGIAAVLAVLHDVLVTLGAVVVFNALGIVDCEIDLSMIAAFLTIIGYSINDTIVIFDRVRENLTDMTRLGEKIDRKHILNLSINQTLSRTILTTATTMAVIVTQFVVNYHAGTALEGFSFALLIGMIAGTYSTVFIASPIVLFLWKREKPEAAPAVAAAGTSSQPAGSEA